MARPRRIALLGGGFSTDDDTLIDDYLLSVTGRERPRVCFVPTASGDADGYVDRFHRAFAQHTCEPSHLPLFQRAHRDLRTLVLEQDVLYVGGGNTANLLALWRLHGLDQVLREAYQAGVLLCGLSAGAACWLEACTTDSFGPLTTLDGGLGLLPGSFCPHYDSEPEREPAYLSAVASGALPSGWALDDGAVALFTDGSLTEVVTRRPGATLHRVVRVDGDDDGLTQDTDQATAQDTAQATAQPARLLTPRPEPDTS